LTPNDTRQYGYSGRNHEPLLCRRLFHEAMLHETTQRRKPARVDYRAPLSENTGGSFLKI